jgi:HK97 gp10 family phage protein
MAKRFGVEIVYNRLPQLSDEIADRVEAVVRKSGHMVEAYAKQVVPVDTGTLKNSIMTEFPDRFTTEIAPHTEYAIYVEYGTRSMAARPYMRPAAERVRPIFLQAMDKVAGR